MMIYDYECLECGHKFEALNAVENREHMKCVECEGKSRKLFCSKPPSLHIFTPGYWPHIDSKPVWIKDAKHLRDECVKRAQPGNCPSPEFLDGFNNVGMPSTKELSAIVDEKYGTEEERCQKKTKALMDRVEVARQASQNRS